MPTAKFVRASYNSSVGNWLLVSNHNQCLIVRIGYAFKSTTLAVGLKLSLIDG